MHSLKSAALSLVFTLLLLWPMSQAQSQAADTTSLRAGSWALQFGIAGNFTLTSFQGSTISAKYHLSGTSAIRGGITISGNTADGTPSITYVYNDTSNGTMPEKSSSSAQSIGLVLQYLAYANPDGPVHFYAGIGPIVSYNHSQSSSDNSHPYAPRSWERVIYSSSSTQWGAGLIGNIGLEWFAVRWLSIRAEYGESLQYQWRSSSSVQDYSYPMTLGIPEHIETSGPTKGWSLASAAVNFGLSVYW